MMLIHLFASANQDSQVLKFNYKCYSAIYEFNLILLQGACVKDKYGVAYCQCAGSFTGEDCESKSEFAYIAGGKIFHPKIIERNFPNLRKMKNLAVRIHKKLR